MRCSSLAVRGSSSSSSPGSRLRWRLIQVPQYDWGFSAIVRCHHGIGKVCLIYNWLCIPILFPVSPSQVARRNYIHNEFVPPVKLPMFLQEALLINDS